MFGFISAFFHKAAVLVTSVLVAVGLVSAPASIPAPVDLPVSESAETAILAEQFKEPEVPEPAKPEVKAAPAPKPASKPAPKPAPVSAPTPPPAPVVPAVPKTQKLTLPSGAVVEIDDKGQIIGQSSNVPTPAPAPAPVPSAPSQPPLPAGFFRLPSGLIVNEAGNVVNP